MNNNVIYKDEDIYGFIYDIVDVFKEEAKLAIDNGDDPSLLFEALEQARELEKEDDSRFFKVWYNPMGAYIFEEMIIKNKLD